MWGQLFFFLLAAGLIYLMVRHIKADPKSFSKKNLNKSLTTFCYLAFLLIAFIAFLVYMVRH
ncbi:MAG: hypothetical protein AAGA27_02275 [Pseudomonadota bacterium]